MIRSPHAKTVTLGFALFSMFFGAGNVVFPLVVGKATGEYIVYALAGLFITAVLIPFTGLYAATLLDGSHRKFFSPLGKWGGLIVAAIILGLLGPFGVIPRCVTLSQATFQLYFPMNSVLFNFISCALVFIFTLRLSSIVSILGNILTPALIAVLGCIIFIGLYTVPEATTLPTVTPSQAFGLGVTEGYQTMDLLAALFFASFITGWMRKHISPEATHAEIQHWKLCSFKAISLAAALIAAVYVGFGLLASRFGYILEGVPQAELLGAIAGEVLGSSAGLIVCLAVCLACITTAISLAAIFAHFLSEDLTGGKISYTVALAITVGVTFGFTLLDFNGIVGFLGPILSVIYPGLIALTVYNLIKYFWKERALA